MIKLARHIDFWTRNQGPPELGFEHFAWVANQNRVYADLLSETTHGLRVNGQAAFYYLKAAKSEKDRANFIRQIKAQVLQQKCPTNDITETRPQAYFGERTWRETMNTELIQQNELIAMFILQHKECHVDHSLQITKTLNKEQLARLPCGMDVLFRNVKTRVHLRFFLKNRPTLF